MPNNAFARARSMMSLIAAAFSMPVHMQQAALAQITPYKSRGKGGKHPHRRVGTKAHARSAAKSRNQRRHRVACKHARG
jgi:hypothetical protein